MATRRFTFKRLMAALLLSVAALLIWKGPQWLAFTRGVQAYLYAYPLITSEMTRQVLSAPGVKPRLGSGPINHLNHARVTPDHLFRDVVAPNADTLYTIAWLDLTKEPLILHQPAYGQRYLLLQLLDAWSNTVDSMGTRIYGQQAVDYAIVGPGWQGVLPAGVKRVDCPTRMAWIIGRSGTAGAADYDNVHALQDQMRLQPLSQWGQPVQMAADTRPVDPSIDMITPVVMQVARLDAAAYFNRLAQLMPANPPAAADGPMLKTLAGFGIESGRPFDPAQLSAAQRRGLDDAVWFAKAFFEARSPGTQGPLEVSEGQRWFMGKLVIAMNKLLLNERKGWLIPLNLGRYDTQYPLRAVVTLVGFGANLPIDAVYPMTKIDSEGHPLDGTQRYVLHFDKSQLPPASAFWSLTLYNKSGFFVDNVLHRYAIGDRDRLKFNADGSLDLLVQHERPADDANWLPAPEMPIQLMLRLYNPHAEVLDGRWTPPSPRRLP